jgi:predicted nucleic acid-binding Zn ribbon protein
MDVKTLAALEGAIEPYRRAGFVVTSQSETAVTLALPSERFSYLLFIVLLLIWPVAVLYLVSHNLQREKSVCLHFTSQGYIEVSGYTLEDIERERRRRKFTNLLLFSLLAALVLIILVIVYSRGA